MRQRKFPAVFMRGGTSKAVMFHARDLPADRTLWPEIFVAALGAGDPNGRQLDGLGGGISSLSKVCVIGPPSRPDADVDYTFAQLSPKTAEVDYSGNCGNMSGAVGPFAVDEGLVRADGPEAVVRIHNTNTGKLIVSRFALDEGAAAVDGGFALAGVGGSGAPVRLEFLELGGAKTGRLLPTGNPLDRLDVPGLGAIEASLVDAANPCVFVRAADLGLAGTEMPEALDGRPDLLDRLEAIRRAASVAMGIAPSLEAAAAIGSVPKVAFVAPPQDAPTLSGAPLAAADLDVTVRMISIGQPHRAVPLTGGMCLAVAARIDGTLVAEACAGREREIVRIAQPSGVTEIGAVVVRGTDGWRAESAVVYRTARRLMDGFVYVSAARTPGLDARAQAAE
jgi:2-methylaconitate isomerase